MAKIQEARVTLEHANPTEAALAFLKCKGFDPEGAQSYADAVDRGQCFKLTGPTGYVFYSLMNLKNGILWVYQAAGQGRGLTQAMLYVIEKQAKAAGCIGVGFQTMRRGLIAKAKKLGYEVQQAVGKGVIMSKGLA